MIPTLRSKVASFELDLEIYIRKSMVDRVKIARAHALYLAFASVHDSESKQILAELTLHALAGAPSSTLMLERPELLLYRV